MNHHTSSISCNSDLDRRYLNFSSHHVECISEALQQKGEIEKLSEFLWNLPPTETIKNNESVLR